MQLRAGFLLLGVLASSAARALDMCKYIAPGSPAGCNQVKVSSGGSLPSQSSAHRLNPSAVPTVNSPYGLEAIDSLPPNTDSKSKYNFSLVKGFKQFGTGISTDGDDNFFTHSYTLAARDTYLEKSYEYIYNQNDAVIRTLNAAIAIPIPVGEVGKLVQPSVGLLARYNVPLHQWGGGVGLTAASKFLSVGASYLNQPNEYERTHIPLLVIMGGLGVDMLRVDYARLNYLKGFLQDKPVTLWTVSLNWRHVIVFAGRRSGLNIENIEKVDYLYGVQWLVSRHLALGTMLNYIPGRLSLGAQVFL
ncbi:MAG: hypothetical protein JST16_01185 [Bdellovibrionales bacterium]|nr:hypothetical protein [Bdellovibrionales bacterium]